MAHRAPEQETEFTTTSESVEITRMWGMRTAVVLQLPFVVALSGGLGGGKTVFVQGLARGMGIMSRVRSPSFTVVQEHRGSPSLYHLDVYRLRGPGELESVGYEEYLDDADAGVAIEWAERISDALPSHRLEVRFELGSPGRRILTFEGRGLSYQRAVERLREYQSCLS